MTRKRNWPEFLHLFCFVLRFSRTVQALRGTRTIDDAFGSPTVNTDFKPIYSGPNWIARTKHECNNTEDCSTLVIPNNTSLVFNGTWHEARHSPKGSNVQDTQISTLQFSFNGTALSVFCILPPQKIIGIDGTTYPTWPLHLNFILDDQPAGSFNRTTDQLTDNFQYNVPVFSRNNLENKTHTFTMVLNDPTLDSFVLFDYASYVHDDGIGEVQHVEANLPDDLKPEALKKEIKLGLIIAGASGGALLVIFLTRGEIISWVVDLITVLVKSILWLITLILSPIILPIEAFDRRRDLKRRIPNALEETGYSFRYNSSAQPSYLKLLGDTRSQYAYGLLSDWAHTSLLKKDVAGVYWLQGSDNIWRSAVAQKLAKECEGKELLATFFFSSTDSNRSNPRYLALAIAHGMLANFGTRNGVIQAVQDSPNILDPEASVESQFKTLVIGAFSNWRNKLYETFRFSLHLMAASSTLIIFDSLDECGSNNEQEQVLSLVLSAMEKQLPFRFLICSRPTDHLQQQFDKPNLHRYTKILSLDSNSNTPLAARDTNAVTFRVADEPLSSIV